MEKITIDVDKEKRSLTTKVTDGINPIEFVMILLDVIKQSMSQIPIKEQTQSKIIKPSIKDVRTVNGVN